MQHSILWQLLHQVIQHALNGLGVVGKPHGFGHNDLQPVAQRLCPGVTQALQWLATHQLHGRMTGSGSAVFAQVQHPLNRSAVQESTPEHWQVRLCSNLGVHPLAEWATA